MKERINCFTADCSTCQFGYYVRESLFGKKMYKCKFNQALHKALDGRDCGEYRCSKRDTTILCVNCNGGH